MQERFPTAKDVMTQYNMKRGLYNFGGRGAAVVDKKTRQLIKIDAIKPDKQKEWTK